MQAPTPDRREQKLARKREAILRSAARAFTRRGYHGTTMDDIASQLLMTKGSLYYYFKDKEDILYSCHDYSLNLALENLRDVQSMDAGAVERLKALIKAHVNIMLDALQGSAMALDFGALSDEPLAQIVVKRDAFEHGFRDLIQEGMREGEFGAGVDPKLASFMILGAINWIAKWYREGGSYDAASIGDEYAALFVEGLRRNDLTNGVYAAATTALKNP